MFQDRKSAEANRYRLELVLLGFVLAGKQQQQWVFDRVSPDDIGQLKLRECFDAIQRKDRCDLLGALSRYGVDAGTSHERVIDAVIDRVEEYREDEAIRDAVGCVMAGKFFDDISSLEDRLVTALELVRNRK